MRPKLNSHAFAIGNNSVNVRNAAQSRGASEGSKRLLRQRTRAARGTRHFLGDDPTCASLPPNSGVGIATPLSDKEQRRKRNNPFQAYRQLRLEGGLANRFSLCASLSLSRTPLVRLPVLSVLSLARDTHAAFHTHTGFVIDARRRSVCLPPVFSARLSCCLRTKIDVRCCVCSCVLICQATPMQTSSASPIGKPAEASHLEVSFSVLNSLCDTHFRLLKSVPCIWTCRQRCHASRAHK